MTIGQIKKLTAETAPNYFSKDTMRFFKQRMSDFSVIKCEDGRYRISALVGIDGAFGLTSVRFFNPENNKLENE